MTYWSCGLLEGQFGHEAGQILTRELPLERGGGLLVPLLESQDAILHGEERVEIVRRQHLALENREVDLDLIQP